MSPNSKVVVTGVVALLSGLAGGFALASYTLERTYAEKADQEIEEMRKYFVENPTPDDSEDEDVTEEIEDLAGEVEKLKTAIKERPIAPRVIKDDTRYSRYYSDGTPDEGEEGEHMDMSEEETPVKPKTKSKAINDKNYVEVTEDEFQDHPYEDNLDYTLYYDDNLMVDFWGNRVADEDRAMLTGRHVFDRPADGKDDVVLHILNHAQEAGVTVTITTGRLPDALYKKHGEWLSENWENTHANTEMWREEDDDDE